MTAVKEQAIEMIKNMPDDKVFYVVNILKGMEGLSADRKDSGLMKSQKAYENLQRYRKSSSVERDYKKELHMIREEKYESLS